MIGWYRTLSNDEEKLIHETFNIVGTTSIARAVALIIVKIAKLIKKKRYELEKEKSLCKGEQCWVWRNWARSKVNTDFAINRLRGKFIEKLSPIANMLAETGKMVEEDRIAHEEIFNNLFTAALFLKCALSDMKSFNEDEHVAFERDEKGNFSIETEYYKSLKGDDGEA